MSFTSSILDVLESYDKFLEWMTPESASTAERAKISKESKILDAAMRSCGLGSWNYALVDTMRNIDKFRTNTLPGNILRPGFTFITRPRLALTDYNLNMNEDLYTLMTKDPEDPAFAIRCNLDTKFCNDSVEAAYSPLICRKNPFMMPLTNATIGIAGMPDWNLETKTTTAGYGGEQQTYVHAYDHQNAGTTATLQVRNPQGGINLHLLNNWFLAMALAKEAKLQYYNEDIDIQNRMPYTVSIYRFVTDPSMRYIEHYCKMTGCFPTASPMGELFNFAESDSIITAGGEFSIPFKVARVDYDRPFILRNFNTLVRRYHNPRSAVDIGAKDILPITPEYNFVGIPYLESDENGRLMMTFRPEDD